jgi:hypothetical protein
MQINFISIVPFPSQKYFNTHERYRILKAVEELSINKDGGVAQDRVYLNLGRPHAFGNNVQELIEQGKLYIRQFGVCDSDIRLYVADND